MSVAMFILVGIVVTPILWMTTCYQCDWCALVQCLV